MLKRGVQEGPDCGQGRRHTESDLTTPTEVMAGLNPEGYRTLQYGHGAIKRLQNVFLQNAMV